MTREQAREIVKGLMGWNDPKIEENEFGDIYITAVDPFDDVRKIYNPLTGLFERY